MGSFSHTHTCMLVHRSFAKVFFCTDKFARREAVIRSSIAVTFRRSWRSCTQELLHTESLSQRSLCTEKRLQRKILHIEKLLHTDAFEQGVFHTQKRFNRKASIQSSLYTQARLRTEACEHTHVPQKLSLHRETFTQSVPTDVFLQIRDAFTYRGAFMHRCLLRRNFHTENLLNFKHSTCYTDAFLHRITQGASMHIA